MRPRHYAVDNRRTKKTPAARPLASMRPRHYAVDNGFICR